MSAKDNPVGTLRRGVTNWGFWHLFKLCQPKDAPCWDIIDAYGSMLDLTENRFLTDEEVDARGNTVVVYTPIGDQDWAWAHNLPTGEDRNDLNIV